MLSEDHDKLASILYHGRPACHTLTDHWVPELWLLLVTIETRHLKQVAVTGEEQDIQKLYLGGGVDGLAGKVPAVQP